MKIYIRKVIVAMAVPLLMGEIHAYAYDTNAAVTYAERWWGEYDSDNACSVQSRLKLLISQFC